MGLMTFQSLYSWYGNQPPGFQPNSDVQDTDFVYNSTGAYQVSVPIKGFSNSGYTQQFGIATARDSFQIDNVTFSQRGFASRAAQQGNGSRFPIGPAGQIHDFDIERLGFNPDNKYADTYGPNSNSGLADTYTADSPIDDMYNKYKVRDEAYNPFTFPVTREPFILRGIQRDDNSDPQRWGLAGTTGGNISTLLDIPRGGPLAFGERTFQDVIRLGKFAISPKGLAFITKQFGLQFMNPNTENIIGTARGLRLTQLYDPTSFLVNTATAGIGIRFDRHLPPIVTRGRYSQIIGARKPLGTQIIHNRLVRLMKEYNVSIDAGRIPATQLATPFLTGAGSTIPQLPAGPLATTVGLPSLTLSAAAGPKSVLGIGVTNIRRTVSTTTDSINNPVLQTNRPRPIRDFRYLKTDFPEYSGGDQSEPQIEMADPEKLYTSGFGLGGGSDIYTAGGFPGSLAFRAKAVYPAGKVPPGLPLDSTGFVPSGDRSKVGITDTAFGTYSHIGFKALSFISDNNITDELGYLDKLRSAPRRFIDFRRASYNRYADGPNGGLISATDVRNKIFLDGNVNVLNAIQEDGFLPTVFDVDPEFGNFFNLFSLAARTLPKDDPRNPGYDYDGGYTPVVNGVVLTLDTTNYNQIRALAKQDRGRGTKLPIDFRKIVASGSSAEDIALNGVDIKFDLTDSRRWVHYIPQKDKTSNIAKRYDLIHMQFGSGVDSQPKFQFYAYISDLSDQSSPNFDTGQDLGTINPRYQFTSYERTIGLTFIAPAFNQEHYDDVWQNLKGLYEHSWGGTAIDVNIGGVHQELTSIITDMTYNWDTEYPWDIDPDRGKPIYTEVSITFKVLSATGNTNLFNTDTHPGNVFAP
jgi:hypothetical protein